MLKIIIAFLKEVQIEMKKVTWPTRQETLRYTMVVVLFSLAVSIFLGAFDFLFLFLVDKIIVK